MDLASFLKNHLFSFRNLSIFSFLSSLIYITKYNSQRKHLKLLLILPFLMLPSIAFAGKAKRHQAGTITQGIFPENYTFNGTVNMTPTGVAVNLILRGII